MSDADRPKSDVYTRKGGAALCLSQEDLAPPRVAGTIFSACVCFHDTDADAYLYVPGQRRVRKAPEIGFYDSPSTGSGGLRKADSRWMMFTIGTDEWYEFARPVRWEMYIPSDSYKISLPGITFKDTVRPGQNNPDLKRYELHRV